MQQINHLEVGATPTILQEDMRTKIWKTIYAINPTTKEVIDEFSSVSDLHSSMSIRGINNYDVEHYCEFLIDDEAIAEGTGFTYNEARVALERNLIKEYHATSQTIKANPNLFI